MLDLVAAAKTAGWSTVLQDREVTAQDTFVADLAVAVRAGQLRIGGIGRSEHLEVYNRLCEIEDDMGAESVYVGTNYRRPTA